jgi:hypothetical protein
MSRLFASFNVNVLLLIVITLIRGSSVWVVGG